MKVTTFFCFPCFSTVPTTEAPSTTGVPTTVVSPPTRTTSLNVTSEPASTSSFSGHKFHSVRGVGFIYKKEGKKLNPLLAGGGQEGDLRSTTENVAGIAATAKALRLVTDKEAYALPKIATMKEIIYDELAKHKDILIFSGKDGTFAPNILTFGIKGVRGEVVVHAFEEHEIYISTTSACSSKAGKPAGTLIAMGVPTKLAQSAVRISLDDDNDMGQIEQFLTIFKQVYEKTQKVR